MKVIRQQKKRKYTRKSISVDVVKPIEAYVSNNPFTIEEGITLTGNRHGNSTIALMLVEQVKKLPIDKNVSVVIPKTVAESANAATNLVLKTRRMLQEDPNVSKDFAITIRIFKDANGNFVNSRVWRIS